MLANKVYFTLITQNLVLINAVLNNGAFPIPTKAAEKLITL